MSKKALWLVLILTLVGTLALLSACSSEAELGSEDNPIKWVVVPSGEVDRVTSGFESLATLLQEETGLYFEPFIATEYAGAIEAMCSDPAEAHMSSLATFAYVIAADRDCAEAAMLSVRFGSPTYNGQFLVHEDSGIKTLEELAGKTYCRSEPLSTSSWVVPSIMLRAAGVDPDSDLADILDAGSHEAVAASVYNGDCDVGATYVDARTRIEEDYPDVMEKTVVIAVEPDIPNDGVQFVKDFDSEMRDKIVQGLLAISQTEVGVEALDTAYQWQELIEADDSFYDAFRQIVQAAGISAEDLMGE